MIHLWETYEACRYLDFQGSFLHPTPYTLHPTPCRYLEFQSRFLKSSCDHDSDCMHREMLGHSIFREFLTDNRKSAKVLLQNSSAAVAKLLDLIESCNMCVDQLQKTAARLHALARIAAAAKASIWAHARIRGAMATWAMWFQRRRVCYEKLRHARVSALARRCRQAMTLWWLYFGWKRWHREIVHDVTRRTGRVCVWNVLVRWREHVQARIEELALEIQASERERICQEHRHHTVKVASQILHQSMCERMMWVLRIWREKTHDVQMRVAKGRSVLLRMKNFRCLRCVRV